MIKVAIIGTGNVSHHLEQAFSRAPGIHLVAVMGSRGLRSDSFVGEAGANRETPDLYVLAVSDDAIPEVAKHFIPSEALVVHTSGSVALEALSPLARQGVFYPLQTFSRERKVDFRSIPFCIEAQGKEDLQLLRALAESISDHVYEINSNQRRTLHLAAVFVNNFTNHLYQIGSELCENQDLPFDLLKPLIKETAQKIETLAPIEAQTGPAKRNDVTTLKRHLAQLTTKKQKEIYSILTQSIQEVHGEKL